VIPAVGVVIIVTVLAAEREETDPDQRWLWDPRWLAGELEAEREIAAGRGIQHDSDETFVRALHEGMKAE